MVLTAHAIPWSITMNLKFPFRFCSIAMSDSLVKWFGAAGGVVA